MESVTNANGKAALFSTESYVMSLENHTLPQKMHSHYYCELLYVMKGTASVTLESKKHILTKGSVILVHSSVRHSVTSGLGTRVASVCFDPGALVPQGAAFEDLPFVMEGASASLCAQVLFPPGSLSETVMEFCFSQCVNEAKRQQHGYDIAINAACGRIVLEIIRRWDETGFSAASRRSHKRELDINSVTAYISDHCEEPIKVEELAAKCGMSYSYFARCFRERYGSSCKEYIEKLRVEKAEKLLLFTGYDLSFISQELGFSDCSHLIKVFKKHKGVTPRQFRLQTSTKRMK